MLRPNVLENIFPSLWRSSPWYSLLFLAPGEATVYEIESKCLEMLRNESERFCLTLIIKIWVCNLYVFMIFTFLNNSFLLYFMGITCDGLDTHKHTHARAHSHECTHIGALLQKCEEQPSVLGHCGSWDPFPGQGKLWREDIDYSTVGR